MYDCVKLSGNSHSLYFDEQYMFIVTFWKTFAYSDLCKSHNHLHIPIYKSSVVTRMWILYLVKYIFWGFVICVTKPHEISFLENVFDCTVYSFPINYSNQTCFSLFCFLS